ncbi:MAG: sporulation protein YunB [Clostridia bacterium]|nr:sporulation protein YunB [Clostridia bacterium]
MSNSRRYNYRKKILRLIFVLLLISLVGLIFFEIRAKPVIIEMAVAQSENIASAIIENAIVTILYENDITYSSLVDVEKDKDGRVVTVKADTIKMNMLKSKIGAEISNDILETDSREISIPLGTIIGISALSGKGPKIKTTVTLASNVTSTINNSFTSSGINQTLHEIYVNVNATIYVIMPKNSATAEVDSNYCIAQTVIIGTVPETFADFQNKGEQNE